MIRAKNCETVSKFVTVMPRNTVASFFPDTVYIASVTYVRYQVTKNCNFHSTRKLHQMHTYAIHNHSIDTIRAGKDEKGNWSWVLELGGVDATQGHCRFDHNYESRLSSRELTVMWLVNTVGLTVSLIENGG